MIVRFYGRLADTIGRQAEVNMEGATCVGHIRRLLLADHPGAADTLSRARVCLGDMLVDDGQSVSADDHVEFLPPVSGG